MLHVSPQGGQARAIRRASWAATLLLALGGALPAQAQQAGAPTLAEASTLAGDGQHLAAARLYERLARRGFMSWDAQTALLAAREYALAGSPADAERLLDKARSRVRSDEERILLAEVGARIALQRGDAAAALVLLRALPAQLPAESAIDVLALRGQAEIESGDPLAGIRSFEERRAQLLTAPARAQNDRLLFELLSLHPPAAGLAPAGAADVERGWLELPAVLADAGDDAARRAAASEWAARHPGHPGLEFLPADTPAGGTTTFVTIGAGPDTRIALLLPLSGRQQAAGTAVRDGFTAAWFASSSAPTRPRVQLYDTAALGAATAYQRAIDDGARLIVGPLTKDDILALVASQPAGLSVPTLALNSALAPGMQTPAFLYQFGLDPEQEARAVARRIAADGLVRGVALYPDTAWGQRIRAAFEHELQATGLVTLTSAQFYGAGAKDFSGPLRAALGRFGGAGDRSSNPAKPLPPRNPAAEQAAGPQFAFVAATPQTARAIKPQLRFQMTYDLPLYSTSDAWDASVRSASEMDGMVFPEMPWVLYGGQGAPELWDALHDDWSSRGRGRLRLYAFGYDAFRLAQQIGSSGGVAAGLDGLTGLLELDRGDGHVQRGLQFARIESGKLQAAGPAGAVFRDTPAENATGTTPPQ